MKRVAILGSTGSIGTQTLSVISEHPDQLSVTALAAKRNAELLSEQASLYGVRRCALFEGPEDGAIPTGMQALIELATAPDVDIVVVAVAGVIGLLPTLAAIGAGKQIALASKEVLVAGGSIVMDLARKHRVHVTPIDSEHSAVFQCIEGYRKDQVAEIILTASGGPFRGKTRKDLGSVTIADALNHPTWRMGGKITVDSATLMNKALETIEARWLFDIPLERVSAVIHPQSIVHSFVKFTDGSVLGQLGWPDMRLPIAYALLYPERLPNSLPAWNPTDSPNLTFEPIDEETFPALRLAKFASAKGGTAPAVFNAANEEAANAFLRSEVAFLEITEIVERTVEALEPEAPELESILKADAQAREFARNLIGAPSR